MRARRWRDHTPASEDERRDKYLRDHYNISLSDFANILADQGGVCGVCGGDDPKGRNWCVDHDHSCCDTEARSCGQCVRGVLCHVCNRAIGWLGDSPDVLRRAAEYIERADR